MSSAADRGKRHDVWRNVDDFFFARLSEAQRAIAAIISVAGVIVAVWASLIGLWGAPEMARQNKAALDEIVPTVEETSTQVDLLDETVDRVSAQQGVLANGLAEIQQQGCQLLEIQQYGSIRPGSCPLRDFLIFE